jgi:hypothetical protein
VVESTENVLREEIRLTTEVANSQQENIFNPLGMKDSGYEQYLPVATDQEGSHKFWRIRIKLTFFWVTRPAIKAMFFPEDKASIGPDFNVAPWHP